MFVVIFILAFLIYLAANIIYVLCRNYRAQKLFQLKKSQLPVLPNASLFHGHLLNIIRPGKNWLIVSKLHKKYGDSFGYYVCNQAWVSTKDLDLIKLVYLDRAHKHINRCKFGLPFKEFNDSIFQVDGDDWQRIRSAIIPALANHRIKSDQVSADIKHIVNQLAQSLDDNGKEFNLDVHDAFQRYSLAVIFLTTYKRENVINFNLNEKDNWIELMNEGLRSISSPIVVGSIMFPFLRQTCSFLSHFLKIGLMQDKIIDYITKATDLNRETREFHEKYQQRLSITLGQEFRERKFSDLKRQGNFKRRLVDSIIDSFMDKKITYNDFVGSTFFLLFAGFETIASTLTCLMWHLARDEELQEKLRESILKDGIESEYLLWSIKETIRWHPAVPLGTGRVLGEDVQVNGILYPKGSFIMPSTYSIHHDSDIWPEADKFKPERWAQACQFHPASFMGFGLGPRNCLGEKLALFEMKLVVEMLLTKFKIVKCCLETTSEHYDFIAPGLIYTILNHPINVKLISLT